MTVRRKRRFARYPSPLNPAGCPTLRFVTARCVMSKSGLCGAIGAGIVVGLLIAWGPMVLSLL